MQLKIDFDGRVYTFDVSAVTANEWRAVRGYTGHNPLDVFEGVSRTVVEDVEAAFWLVMRQAGEPSFDFGQRQFPLLGFVEGWNTANEEAGKKDDAEPPKASPSSDSTTGS